METNRRRFLGLMAASLLLPASRVLAHHHTGGLLVSAASDRRQHWLLVTDGEGQTQLRYPLPERAHHVELHPHKPWAAAVARRPGRYIEVVDYQNGRQVKRIDAGEGYHFYGHALFTPDGRWLVSTENDMASNQGQVVVRDVSNHFAPVSRMPSYGVGPHELLLNGSEVIVANGGILTRNREKLNLDSMEPSLAYIDLDSGKLLEQVGMSAENHQLSIRHLDRNPAGTVAIALQSQGPVSANKPLVALHRRGQPLKLLRAPEPINNQMEQYAGSARIDRSGRIAAISAPRGNLITFWDLEQDRFISAMRCRDGCGLSATEVAGEFLVSSGIGHLYRMRPEDNLRERLPLDPIAARLAWDNHLSIKTA
ncbi:DUF1513 domain-containing protein [Marinobacterium weihaiense]|uniref:DUF1513 domain-containing protein n=1 Tax=Marinobacterium weihaiense TaxID=2851016 RepID=A0ABS6MD50_9GAMM|nr:DUF1513 domain-containing protein [Marinobacterium weihaiense]MBV0933761.1 DUF1513 domain-containing protein [Marinobacterium weihaiense]